MIEQLYTVEEAAGILKVSARSVRSLIRSKKLRAARVGKEYRIAESELQRFLKPA